FNRNGWQLSAGTGGRFHRNGWQVWTGIYTQREIGFYNKYVCQKNKNRSVRFLPENSLRCEVRFKKYVSVKRHIPSIHNFQSIFNSYEELNEVFSYTIKKEFFIFDSYCDSNKTFNNDPDVLLSQCFEDKPNKGAINEFFLRYSITFLLEEFKTFENIKAWMIRNAKSKPPYSYINKIKNACERYLLMDSESNILIKELINAFGEINQK
ncbi:MAG: hypothetical protein JXB49_08990, partial [Bacteroidales bacterium]|nr:hypothetical protein [Bacteroidales bacterium]